MHLRTLQASATLTGSHESVFKKYILQAFSKAITKQLARHVLQFAPKIDACGNEFQDSTWPMWKKTSADYNS